MKIILQFKKTRTKYFLQFLETHLFSANFRFYCFFSFDKFYCFTASLFLGLLKSFYITAAVCMGGLLLSDVISLLVVCVDLHSIISDIICAVRGPIYSGYVSLLLRKHWSYTLTLLHGTEAEYIFFKEVSSHVFIVTGAKKYRQNTR